MIRAAVARLLGRQKPDLLPEGELAPDWVLRDPEGGWHANGNRWRVLLVSPTETEAWGSTLAELQAHDVAVHVLSPVPTGLPTLIDPESTVTRRFGAVPGRPATFLVNPAGKIRMSQASTAPPVAVLRSVVALREAAPERM